MHRRLLLAMLLAQIGIKKGALRIYARAPLLISILFFIVTSRKAKVNINITKCNACINNIYTIKMNNIV